MNNTKFTALIFILMISAFAGCLHAESAKATLSGTTEGSTVSGTIVLDETAEGLYLKAEISGAPEGLHGFHIHENGSCEDGGKAAGGHFNPDGVQHGDLVSDGFEHAHAGDLSNVEIGADGTGVLEKFLPGLTLGEGKYNVAGKAVILHEKADDFGQPTGNAGGRIGCGLIEKA